MFVPPLTMGTRPASPAATGVLALLLSLATVAADGPGTSFARADRADEGHQSLEADEGRQSLEEWLAGLRARQAQAQSVLGAELEAIAQSFALLELPAQATSPAAAPAGPDPDLEQAIRELYESGILADIEDRLVALGSEAAPLFCAWIAPQGGAGLREELKAEVATRALRRLSIGGIEPELTHLLAHGSRTGRANAARVLANSPAPERVGPLLADVFKREEGALQRTVLRSIFELPGTTRLSLLDEVLGGDSAPLKRIALEALAELRGGEFEPHVAALLSDQDAARPFAQELLGFYRACPETCEKDELLALVALAGDARVSEPTRLAILEAVPELTPKLTAEIRKAFDDLRDHRKATLREATLIALGRLGDRAAQREVLEPYDLALEKNPEWAARHAERADVLYRLGDWTGAIKGYKKALQASRDDPSQPAGVHIGLARCYASTGKLKDAAQWLEQAPITTRELRVLADDPVFRALREHPRYGAVFRL